MPSSNKSRVQVFYPDVPDQLFLSGTASNDNSTDMSTEHVPERSMSLAKSQEQPSIAESSVQCMGSSVKTERGVDIPYTGVNAAPSKIQIALPPVPPD
eukprot:1237407-Ditylum_brightwellii.AAC.1